MINTSILKTRDGVYTCAHGRDNTKCVYRKLNVADLQCRYKGKFTLNIFVYFKIVKNVIGI